MSTYSGFSTKTQENYYNNLCISLITSLSQRVLLALKHDYVDDSQFSRTILNTYKKLVEIELQKYIPPKFSEGLNELVSYLGKNFSNRSNSNDSSSPRKFTPDKGITSKTPNLSFLDRIIEEVPRNNRTTKKLQTRRRIKERAESSNHPYYENMMGKYLKMTLKSPLRGNQVIERGREKSKQIQLTDGMFFRLY